MFHFHFSLPKGGFLMTMFAVAKDATRHVGFGVVERTRGAKSVLFAEMSESMDVLNNVATVLEVLGKRTRDLEAQQRQILRHWQGQLRRKYRHVSYTHMIIYHIWYHMYIIFTFVFTSLTFYRGSRKHSFCSQKSHNFGWTSSKGPGFSKFSRDISHIYKSMYGIYLPTFGWLLW